MGFYFIFYNVRRVESIASTIDHNLLSSSSSSQTRIRPKRPVPRLQLISPPYAWSPESPLLQLSLICWGWHPKYVFLPFTYDG